MSARRGKTCQQKKTKKLGNIPREEKYKTTADVRSQLVPGIMARAMALNGGSWSKQKQEIQWENEGWQDKQWKDHEKQKETWTWPGEGKENKEKTKEKHTHILEKNIYLEDKVLKLETQLPKKRQNNSLG